MPACSPRLAPVFLLTSLFISTACDDGAGPPGASPTAPGGFQAITLTAEPATATPEIVPTDSCLGFPPFRTRVVVIVGGRTGLTIRRLLFRFTDRFGHDSLPTVFPDQGSPATRTSSSSSIPLAGPVTIPTSSPLTIPTSSAVTIPTSSAVPIPSSSAGAQVSASGFAHLPFLVEFGCGVPPAGTLVISAETTDPDGRPHTSTVDVRVGS